MDYEESEELGEQNKLTHNSKPAKHLNKNIKHNYNWKIFANAYNHKRTTKSLEAIHLALLRASFCLNIIAAEVL